MNNPKKKMEEQLYDDLLIELECPICKIYMSPPIRQCATGHNICQSCYQKLENCPICQAKLTETRNKSLESLAEKVKYPCINKELGCAAKFAYNEREAHEKVCHYQGYHCAMEKCPWVGKLDQLAEHWASKRMSSKPYQKSNICYAKMKIEAYYVNIVNAYGKLFWFKFKLTKNRMYWVVQYIGSPQEAQNYYYEVEIFKTGKREKKILISDYCQRIDLDNQKLFRDDVCISVDCEAVSSFVSPSHALIYCLRVNWVDRKPKFRPFGAHEMNHNKEGQGSSGSIFEKGTKI